MKNKLIGLLILLSAIMAQGASAQNINYSQYGNIVVVESTTIIDGFEAPAYIVYFEDEIKSLEGAWKSYLKDHYNIKQRNERGFLKAKEVSMPDISSKAVTLYSHFEAERPSPKFLVAVAVSRDTFIEDANYPEKVRAIKSMMIKFIKSHQLELINDELADVQKTYDKMNSELAKIEKDKAGELKDKLKSEGDIVKDKGSIEKNKRKMLDIQAEIEKLQQAVEKENMAIAGFEAKINDFQKNIDQQKETIILHKAKMDKIIAKKDLIISQPSMPQ